MFKACGCLGIHPVGVQENFGGRGSPNHAKMCHKALSPTAYTLKPCGFNASACRVDLYLSMPNSLCYYVSCSRAPCRLSRPTSALAMRFKGLGFRGRSALTYQLRYCSFDAMGILPSKIPGACYIIGNRAQRVRRSEKVFPIRT